MNIAAHAGISIAAAIASAILAAVLAKRATFAPALRGSLAAVAGIAALLLLFSVIGFVQDADGLRGTASYWEGSEAAAPRLAVRRMMAAAAIPGMIFWALTILGCVLHALANRGQREAQAPAILTAVLATMLWVAALAVFVPFIPT